MKGLLFQRTSSFKGYNLLYFDYFSSPFFSRLSFFHFSSPNRSLQGFPNWKLSFPWKSSLH